MRYARLVDRKIVECDAELATLSFSDEEWAALDLSAQYEYIGNNILLLLEDATPEVITSPEIARASQSPPKPLEIMYNEKNCGLAAQVEALWRFALTGEIQNVRDIEAARQDVRAEYEKKLTLYRKSR